MVYNMVTTEIVGITRKDTKTMRWLRKYELLTDKELSKYISIPADIFKRVDISQRNIKTICGCRYPNPNKLNCKLSDL